MCQDLALISHQAGITNPTIRCHPQVDGFSFSLYLSQLASVLILATAVSDSVIKDINLQLYPIFEKNLRDNVCYEHTHMKFCH